jgi:hypothetical protein
MRSLLFFLLVSAISMFILGCGGGSSVIPGTTGTLTGTIYAPNGVDPVSGALIYVEDRSGGATGEPPTDPYLGYTYSEADGTFIIPDIPTGTQTVMIVKGAFSKETEITVTDGDNPLPAETTTLPSTTGGGGTVEKMAVVTGYFDSIENVLAKLGMGTVDSYGLLEKGTETFDLIDGSGELDDTDYPEFLDFFGTPSNYTDFRTIFINCGNGYEEEFFANPTAVDGLKAWVNAGGRLYVTDQAYDFVEQLFAEYIDFYGEEPGLVTTPESQNYAQGGDGFDETNATILNANLLAWLKAIGVTNADDTVTIEGWLGAWVPIDAVGASTSVWVQAPVWVDQEETVRPVTVTFKVGLGTVFFSSYHTEDSFSTAITPQDRILQYFVFEVL